MGYVELDTAMPLGDTDRDVSRGSACSDHHLDDLRLDSESIIFEITPDGWCATKLTKLGWFRGSALTIAEAIAVLSANIRAAAQPG
jgi:hypothetical protein